MKLDIEKILNQVGGTKDEFAGEIGITLEHLNGYCNGKIKMDIDTAGKISSYTGLSPNAGGMFIAESEDSFNRAAISRA